MKMKVTGSGYRLVSRFNPFTRDVEAVWRWVQFLSCCVGVSERFYRPVIEFKDPYDVSVENYGLPRGAVAGQCRYDGNW